MFMLMWLFRLAEGGGLIPVLISCQLRELIHLASWQDSRCEHVMIMIGVLSHPMDGFQEGTHTASQEGCCGVWTDGWTVVRQDGTRWGQTGGVQMVTSW